MSRSIRRVLIANRGEVAVRIIRACRELGISPVVVFSDADAHSRAVRLADYAVRIGEAPPAESYLRADRIVEAALNAGCDAVHPGFGFLSENADFAEAVQRAGLIFVGPDPAAIRTMGLKTAALAAVRASGVPTLPNFDVVNAAPTDYQRAAAEIGYPVLVKAAAGGGGKGMRIVRAEVELSEALDSAAREAQKAFSDARVFLEKYIEQARHIEVQIFADPHGSTLHLFERDCSTQRRHQKIIEESASPFLSDPARAPLRAAMFDSAIRAAQAVGYVNAGTVEFIVDAESGAYYFLEMNTRLQVEHPVTELITGLDLVKLQFLVASGEKLPFTQSDLSARGHAIECRIYAEDPANGFLPSIGQIAQLVEPQAPGVRIDSGVEAGDAISIYYDPMIAKLIVYGEDRQHAIQRMDYALSQYVVMGLTTNIPFLRAVLNADVFRSGQMTTSTIEREFAAWQPSDEGTVPDLALIAAALGEMLGSQARTLNGTSDHSPNDGDGDTYSTWARADGFRMGGR